MDSLSTIAINFVIFFTFILFVIPSVGIPLMFLFKMSAYFIDFNHAMIADALILISGHGVRIIFPFLVIIVLAGLGIRAWTNFVEARHGWVGTSIIAAASIGCVSALIIMTIASSFAFGIIWSIVISIIITPLSVAYALTYLPFVGEYITWIHNNLLKGTWKVNNTDMADLIPHGLIVIFIVYVFYSLISIFIIQLTGLSSSYIYRLNFINSIKNAFSIRIISRFKTLPEQSDLAFAIRMLARALLLCVAFGIIVYFAFRCSMDLITNHEMLARSILRAASYLGLSGPGYGWVGGIFLSGSTIVAIVAALSLYATTIFHTTAFLRAQLIEVIVVIISSSIIFIALANANVDLGKGHAIFLFFIPLCLVLLFSRSCFWQAALKIVDRLRSGQQRSIEEVVKSDSLAPILYLRAFKDDSLMVGRGFRMLDLLMGSPVRRRRFEEIVAGRGFRWRPLVALGNPHIPFNLHGVLKKSVSDDDWQSEVTYWHDRCAYVLMIANKTDNLAWEIELIQSTRGSESAIFVVTSVDLAREFFDHYNIFSERLRVPDATLVVFRDPLLGWIAVSSRLRSEVAYSTALDIAFARTECAPRNV